PGHPEGSNTASTRPRTSAQPDSAVPDSASRSFRPSAERPAIPSNGPIGPTLPLIQRPGRSAPASSVQTRSPHSSSLLGPSPAHDLDILRSLPLSGRTPLDRGPGSTGSNAKTPPTRIPTSRRGRNREEAR